MDELLEPTPLNVETVMKKFAVVLAVLVAVVSGQTLGQDQSGPDYYPLRAGTKWTYRVVLGGEAKGMVINQIAKIEKIDDQSLARQETVAQGNVAATEHLSSTAKGIFRHRYNGVEVVPPVCVLRYPVKQGDSWGSEAKVGDQTIKMTSRVGEEEVTVPAGKYKAITVQVDGDAAGTKIRTTYWFVANIGFVKQVADIAGNQIILEMEKFEAGK